MKNKLILTLFAFCLMGLFQAQSQNVEKAMLGEIKLFAGDYAPKGWMFCDGQLLTINNTNNELFYVLGTAYGGDGRTTFGLPDLRGRIPIGPMKRQGLTNVWTGQKNGKEKKVVRADIPIYSLNTSDAEIRWKTEVISVVDEQTIAISETSKFYVQPSLGLNYIICIDGELPSRF